MKSLCRFISVALILGLIAPLSVALAEQEQEAEAPQERRPAVPAADPRADPRWGAPGWGDPAWWDPAMFDIDVAMVRVAQLSPNAPEADLIIHWPEAWWGEEAQEVPAEEEFEDARTALEGLAYGDITEYVMVPAGTHTVWFSEPGENGEAWFQQEIDFSAGAYYTVAAVGFIRGIDAELDAQIEAAEEDVDVGWLEGLFMARDPEDLSLRLEVYDDEPANFPDAGWAHVRVINAAPGSPAIDIWAWHTAMREDVDNEEDQEQADAAARPTVAPPAADFHVVGDLPFPSVSGYEAVRAIGYELEVRLADTDVVIHEFPGDELLPGAVYTIFIKGTALDDEAPIEAIALADVRLVSMPAEEVEDVEEEPEPEEEEADEDEAGEG